MIYVKGLFIRMCSATRRICLGVFVCILCFAPAVHAATDNGCSNEDNDRITAELALCSTHAYNIGLDSNPSTESDKQLMRDVVALKTTVMTQQMKKQYDYLEATIRRFKTQLEKAILTTKLQAAGATGDSSSGGTSTDRNVVLIGAENCLLKSSTSDGLQCIQNNIRIVLQAVSAGNIGEAYRQLQKDLSFAKSYGVYTDIADLDECNKLSSKRDVVNNCAYQLNIKVMQKIEEQNNQQRNNQQQWRQ